MMTGLKDVLWELERLYGEAIEQGGKDELNRKNGPADRSNGAETVRFALGVQ